MYGWIYKSSCSIFVIHAQPINALKLPNINPMDYWNNSQSQKGCGVSYLWTLLSTYLHPWAIPPSCCSQSTLLPCARHIWIPPSPCIPVSQQSSSCICHLPQTIHASWHSYPCILAGDTPHIMVPMLNTSIPAAHPSSIVLTHVMHSCDPTHAMLWDVCHFCTHVLPNWVLPAVHRILLDEIHCVVMSHFVSYCCPPRSNCKFYFNSTCPNMLAYLPSPVSQNYRGISARCSLRLCSI